MAPAILDFLSAYSPEVQAVARAAQAAIREVMPDALEMVDAPSRIVAYGLDRTYKGLICAIAPHTAHVNLMFARGVELPDPKGLLEGTGKKARHVKLTAPAEARQPAVRALLKAALKMART